MSQSPNVYRCSIHGDGVRILERIQEREERLPVTLRVKMSKESPPWHLGSLVRRKRNGLYTTRISHGAKAHGFVIEYSGRSALIQIS